MAPSELIGDVTIEQTPYFDVRKRVGIKNTMTAIFEDDDKMDPLPESRSGDDIWSASPYHYPDSNDSDTPDWRNPWKD